MRVKFPNFYTEYIRGWQAVIIENEQLKVTVLPEKGADIYSIYYKPQKLEFLARTPAGLQAPEAPKHPLSGDLEFMWNYEGAWQELFPSANVACEYDGVDIPFHGEVHLLPWLWRVDDHSENEIAITFVVECKTLPFQLERTLRLKKNEAVLYLDEKVINLSDEKLPFVWGHHTVIGAPFLEAGCVIECGAKTITTLPQVEPTAKLKPNQTEQWPLAESKNGKKVDLSQVPGPKAGTHDDALLTDLSDGFISVLNPKLNLTFKLEWDKDLFEWIVLWQPYGVKENNSLKGVYALGIEPWTYGGCLSKAIEAGKARYIDGGSQLTTALIVTIF